MSKEYKTTKEKNSFSIGLLTMLLASIGTDLFGAGGWMTYLGLAGMIIAAIVVWKYVRKPKEEVKRNKDVEE
jgi:positive regulator of sigma E activity